MSGDVSSVNLWVRPESFNLGTFPLPLPDLFNFKYLKRIVLYAKTKSGSEDNILSYSVWEHIACDKFRLHKEVAWLYFENYFLVHLRKIDERIEWDRRLSDATEKDVEEIKSKVEVCSLRFVLMLYLQNIHKTSLCSSVVMQEEWPSQIRQSRHKRQDHTEQKQLMFVRTNLEEIMGLLTDEDKFTDEIPEYVIEALSFLIEGSSDKNRTIMTLHDIVSMEENQKETGFKMESRMFDYRKLVVWIKTHLGPNPFDICTGVARERCLSWPRIGSSNGEDRNGHKTKCLFTNAHYAPKNKRVLILHRLNRQTWVRSSRIMHGCNIKVQQCSQSYLYLLSAFKTATVTDCRDLTVVLGPVTTLLDVSNCKNLQIIAMARRIHITNCNKVTAYLRTPGRPLLLGSRNLNVRFAPYNTFYPLLEKQMEKAGITTHLNMWDRCLCIYNKMKVEELTSQLSMMPSTFKLFSVPFEMEGETKDIPGGLPSPYQHSVDRKQEVFQNWQKRMSELDLSDEQKESILKTVHQKFKHWLKISGHQQELDSLAMLAEKLSMESSR